jgi:hypothetical protein
MKRSSRAGGNARAVYAGRTPQHRSVRLAVLTRTNFCSIFSL